MGDTLISPSVKDLLLHTGHVIEVYEYTGSAVIACDTCQTLLVEVWKGTPSVPVDATGVDNEHEDAEHSYDEARQAFDRSGGR